MSKIRINFNKNIQMHLATGCYGFRPVFENIYFKNGYMYASDAKILVKNKISEVSNFTEEQIALLEDKYLHQSEYKDLLKEDIVTITSEGFIAKQRNRETLYKFNVGCGVFPENIDRLFEEKRNPVDKIGIDIYYLEIIRKTLQCNGKIAMFFTKESYAIIIRDSELKYESKALIMPLLINND